MRTLGLKECLRELGCGPLGDAGLQPVCVRETCPRVPWLPHWCSLIAILLLLVWEGWGVCTCG